ncbi:MAG: site-specific recombinase [Massilia sp.]
MLPTLERIDPHSEKIDMLVALVDQLRPPSLPGTELVTARLQHLCLLLAQRPDLASALHSYLTRLSESRRHASVYTDIGILSNDGFFTELKRRLAYRLLPPALGDVYLNDAIDQVLYKKTDYLWINAVPTAAWLQLVDAIAAAAPVPDAAPADPQRTTLLGMLEAIRTLSCRVCALGLEPRLIRSHADIENFDSPFLMQNIEVNDYLDGYARLLAGETGVPEDARHLLVMLDQCSAVIDKVRKNAATQGTTVALTYLLVALAQSIDRLRKLLFLVDVHGTLPAAPTLDLATVAEQATPASEPPTSLRRAGAIALVQELVQAHNNKYAVRELFADNINLLARNVTENASRTGEHYIADSRRELGRMFLSSAGAGFIIAIMALIKLLMASLRGPPLVEAFLFSLNYAGGFVLIHALRFTIATKQPAMTASHIAAALSSKDGRTIDLDSMAELIAKVFRTQCVAVLGNLATVLPMAWLIAMLWQQWSGNALVTPAKAAHMLHDIDPLHSLALMYAAIAGVCLFVAGLISGYYDNKAVYTQMAQRVNQLRMLGRVLGQARLARLALYLENNLGGLMGNIYFGFLLGTMGTLGYLLGLPLDIRHVTFSAANFATAMVALDANLGWELVLTSVAGFLCIGAVNLLVSFSLALWVALRARKVRFRHAATLARMLGWRLASAPFTFLLGPATPAPALHDPMPTRGSK